MKFLIYLILIIIPISTNAQVIKGSWNIGGKMMLTYENKAKPKFTVYAQPDIGYFINNNLSLGVSFITNYEYSTSETNTTRDAKSTSTALGIGPRIAHYFKINDNTYFFTSFKTTFMHSLGKDEYELGMIIRRSIYEINSITHSPGVGLLYMLNNKVGLNIETTYNFEYSQSSFEYSATQIKDEREEERNYLKLMVGFDIFF